MKPRMKQLLREPIVHFVLLGAALFAVFGMINGSAGSKTENIVVTQGQIERVTSGFERTWHRLPSSQEQQGLIDSHIREEVYVREALALGLDRDDAVIRNRLRLKMEFISDTAALPEPTDEDLRAYLSAHAEAFHTEPRFTFTQVYLNPRRHEKRLAEDAERLLARLAQGETPETLGDATLLEHRFSDLSSGEVARQFGEQFAVRLSELPLRSWQGPVESTYGAHLVFVGDNTQGGAPTLDDVRDAVRREWSNAQRVERSKKLYQDLRRRYTVTVEKTQAAQVAQR